MRSDIEVRVRERFERETATHQLKVLRDDGLYRHLRCSAPDTWVYGFDLVTWPGYLAIVGDAGDFVFSRIRDMFEFFESDSGRINPDYWAQKLQAPRGTNAAEVYSHDALRARVLEWVRQECNDEWSWDGAMIYPSLLTEAVEREILSGYTHYEQEGRERIELLEESVGYMDAWEWSLRDWDWQFLWCCHAIVWGIAQYRRIGVAA